MHKQVNQNIENRNKPVTSKLRGRYIDKPIDEIEYMDLPFVEDGKKGIKRSFWLFEMPNNDFDKKMLGYKFALAYLEFVHHNGNPEVLLPTIARDQSQSALPMEVADEFWDGISVFVEMSAKVAT